MYVSCAALKFDLSINSFLGTDFCCFYKVR